MEGLRMDVDQLKHDMAQLQQTQRQSVAQGPPLPVPVAASGPNGGQKGLPPPPYSPRVKAREDMSKEEIKDIQMKSTFEVVFDEGARSEALPPMFTFAPVFINKYDQVEIPSAFMEPVQGVYTTPIQGRYKFSFSVTLWGQGKMIVTIVCGKKRQEFTQWFVEGLYRKLSKSVTEDCEAGTAVSLELVRNCGEIRVTNCKFMGEMSNK